MSTDKPGFFDRFFVSRVADKLAEFPTDGSYNNKFFQNGFAIPLKEGRIVATEIGDQWDSFFLQYSGFSFSHEILQHLKEQDYPHEMDKWWVMPTIQNEEKLKEVEAYFSKNKAAEKWWKAMISNSDNKAALLKNQPQRKLSSFQQKALDTAGVYVFQDLLSGQVKIGTHKIYFYEYRNGEIIEKNEESPYYFATEFPYAFKITMQEDAEYIPTDMWIVVPAAVINAYAAHIKTGGKPFQMFESIVTGTAAEVIRQYPCHEASVVLATQAGKPATLTPEQVLAKIKERIFEELNREENFFGFYFGEIQIVQVEMAGENAAEIKKKVADLYLAEQDQKTQAIKNQTIYDQITKLAEANLEKAKKENEGNADAIKQEGAAKIKVLEDRLAAIKGKGGDTDLELIRLIVAELPENAFIGNLSELLQGFKKKSTIIT